MSIILENLFTGPYHNKKGMICGPDSPRINKMIGTIIFIILVISNVILLCGILYQLGEFYEKSIVIPPINKTNCVPRVECFAVCNKNSLEYDIFGCIVKGGLPLFVLVIFLFCIIMLSLFMKYILKNCSDDINHLQEVNKNMESILINKDN